ncbi:hypothetical protein KEM54_001496 [Ascosphaera aggregata]|nr:hypothetical protein KEM54_001496 [Ascosphaera aggregata]
MCHEVSDLLPSIISQGGPIPHDVEFVENKLETLQEALELDAAGIEACRTTVETDAAEAKLAFRTIDTLLLPLQYQPTPGERWWSSTGSSQARPGHSLRSALGARHTLLALPKDAEEDPSEQNSAMPANLVEYVSRRAETMAQSADWFKTRLTDVELHIRDLEVSLTHQLNDAVARSRGGRDVAAMGYDPAQSQVAELAGALEDIERAILSVAGRVGETKDQVNEISLGPVGVSLCHRFTFPFPLAIVTSIPSNSTSLQGAIALHWEANDDVLSQCPGDIIELATPDLEIAGCTIGELLSYSVGSIRIRWELLVSMMISAPDSASISKVTRMLGALVQIVDIDNIKHGINGMNHGKCPHLAPQKTTLNSNPSRTFHGQGMRTPRID